MDWLLVIPLALMDFSAAMDRPGAHRPDLALSEFVLPVIGSRACWKAEFEDSTPVTNPDEDIAAISFGMMYEWETGGYWDQGRDLFSYELNVSFRDGANGRAVGNCLASPSGPPHCSVECDGGGVEIAKADDGSLTLDLTRHGFIRLRYCGEDIEENRVFSGIGGLKSFNLKQVPPKQCAPIYKPDYDSGID